MQHIILTLVLIMADGQPQAKNTEMPSLEQCWARARAVMERATPDDMRRTGIKALWAGCVIELDAAQDEGKGS